jgi:hypothetical protein
MLVFYTAKIYLTADTLNKIAFQNVVSLKMHQVKNTAGKNILTVL